MDAEFANPNIFDTAFKDKQHLSAELLDRLDYFIYQLKQHGIYVNINLHVAREFGAADGFPETEGLHDFDKAVDFFEPRMIELQKNYARDLLTHLNPYTKTRYVDEPAVAVIEINNENTLLGEAWGSKLDNLPPHYKAELTGLWNAWLKRKYGDTDGLKRAWSAADKPLRPQHSAKRPFRAGRDPLERGDEHAARRCETDAAGRRRPPGRREGARGAAHRDPNSARRTGICNSIRRGWTSWTGSRTLFRSGRGRTSRAHCPSIPGWIKTTTIISGWMRPSS